MAIKKIMLSIDEDVVKELDQLAKSDDRSRNNYVNRIISDHLQSEDKTKELLSKIDNLEKELLEKKLIIKNMSQQVIEQPTKPIKPANENVIKPLTTNLTFIK